jgi:1-phosphatidylinositol phosphodiesterase
VALQAWAWHSLPTHGAAVPRRSLDRRRWMSALPDGLGLSEITIPGTHDSATRGVVRMARCQDLTLSEQLGAGIRFLDIRCKVIEDTLKLYHGPVPLNLFFESGVCDACLGFLASNPAETVILLVSNESGTHGRQFESLVRRSIDGDSARWYLDDRTPSLRQVRGRIVLIRRFPVSTGTAPFGIDGTSWVDDRSFEIANHTMLDIQDQYIVPRISDIDRKWAAIRTLLDRSRKRPAGTWMINYCSGTSGRRPDPHRLGAGSANRDVAEPYPDQVARGAYGLAGENGRFLAYLRDVRPSHALGTILLDYADYPDGALIDQLIRLNFEAR